MKTKSLIALVASMVVLASAVSLVVAQRDIKPLPRLDVQTPEIKIDGRNPRIRINRGDLQIVRPGNGVKINLDKGKELIPELLGRAQGLAVYALQDPKFGANAFGDLEQRIFGGSLGGKQARGGGVIATTDGEQGSNFLILEEKTGYLSFDRGFADIIDGKADNLPREREAEKLARDFFRELDLAPADSKEIVFERVSRVWSASFDPETNREGAPATEALVVHMGRVIDGVQVVGGGSKLIARIADNGQIVGGAVRWRELGGAEKGLKLRDTERILADMQDTLQSEYAHSQSVDVKEIGLFYLDNGGRAIQPVIGYAASIVHGKGLTSEYFGLTPLLVTPTDRVRPRPVTEAMLKGLQDASRDLQPRTEGQD